MESNDVNVQGVGDAHTITNGDDTGYSAKMGYKSSDTQVTMKRLMIIPVDRIYLKTRNFFYRMVITMKLQRLSAVNAIATANILVGHIKIRCLTQGYLQFAFLMATKRI
jgi:hypothetical protein